MSLYWDISYPLSYNALINMFVGQRGGGKTYGCAKYLVQDFLDSNMSNQFVYLRRTDKALQRPCAAKKGTLFSDIAHEFPDIKLETKGDYFELDDGETSQILGYATSLNMTDDFKSSAYPDVSWIWFEEFIIHDTRHHSYLPNEITSFYDIYETIARTGSDHKLVRVLMNANAVTITNPYFDEWGCELPEPGKIRRFGNGDIIVQNVVSPELVEAKKASRFGKIIEGTRYAEYAIENKWLLDSSDFVARKNQACTLACNLVYESVYYGVWLDSKNWRYYISLDHNKQYPETYPVTLEDSMPNLMLAQAARKLPTLKNLLTAYDCGAVRFESVNIKNKMRKAFNIIRGTR